MMVDSAKRPISLVRCPQGRAKQCFFQKHDSGSFGPAVKHVPVKEKKGEVAGLSLHRGRQGPAALRADGDDRVPWLGQPGEAAGKSRPAGVRPRSRRRPRLRQGPVGGRALRDLLADLGLVSFPMTDRRQGHACRRSARRQRRLAEGQRFRRALRPRHRRGRAGALHRQHPQGPAQGPHLPRLAAQPARGDRDHALFGPRPRGRARSPRRSPGRSWTRSRAAMSSLSAMPTNLLERAASKLLAGWGKAKQRLPNA